MDVVYFDPATGFIEAVNDVLDADEAEENIRPGITMLFGSADHRTQYVSGGAVTDRPAVPPMTGTSYDLNQLPAGSSLVVTDEEGTETTIAAQDDTLLLVDAGTYHVRSISPFPAINFASEVTVP